MDNLQRIIGITKMQYVMRGNALKQNQKMHARKSFKMAWISRGHSR